MIRWSRAHHRLPERLRAAVPRRGRAGRQGAGPLQPAPRRRRARPAAQRAVPRERRRAAILAALDAAFARCAAEREPGERFGDFAWRSGLVRGATTGTGGRMRALAWDPDLASREPAMLDEVNARLESAGAAERVRWALEHLPGAHALSSSFGAQAAVSLHLVTRLAPAVPVILVDTGYLFPGDLPVRRRARGAARTQPEGVPAVGVAGLARGAPRPALGAGPRGHRALQRAAQERADAACARGTRGRHLVRGLAPRPVAFAPPHPAARVPRRPLEGASRSSTGPTERSSTTCAAPRPAVSPAVARGLRVDRRLAHDALRWPRRATSRRRASSA